MASRALRSRRSSSARSSSQPSGRWRAQSGVTHTCRDGAAFLLEEGAGYFDPVGALEDVAEAARREGVTVRMRAAVSDVVVQSGAARAVVLADGSRIEASMIINAAGPWCNEIDRMVGLEHD